MSPEVEAVRYSYRTSRQQTNKQQVKLYTQSRGCMCVNPNDVCVFFFFSDFGLPRYSCFACDGIACRGRKEFFVLFFHHF